MKVIDIVKEKTRRIRAMGQLIVAEAEYMRAIPCDDGEHMMFAAYDNKFNAMSIVFLDRENVKKVFRSCEEFLKLEPKE